MNNNNCEIESDKRQELTAGCSSKSLEERPSEEFQAFTDAPTDEDDGDSVNMSDEIVGDNWDDIIAEVSDDSPNSLNSDVDQRWYAFRGRWGINMMDNHNDLNNLENGLAENNQPQPQEPADDDETDFLEMDFEPDTNSEIENATLLHANNSNSFNFPLPLPDFRLMNPNGPTLAIDGPESRQQVPTPSAKNTGAKPKQINRTPKPNTSRRVTDGDDIFKITVNKDSLNPSTSQCHSKNDYSCATDIYNIGASSSRTADNNPPLSSFNQNPSGFMKFHKSPSKSSSHQHKHEEQNDQFLFEIEPLKPRNSVTIYTTNCDEKILIDALTSLNLDPNKEMIESHFNRSRPSTGTGNADNCELNLVDYIIYRSKLNCNYQKLIELIKKACKSNDEDSYSADKKFDINFYPLDLFSTAPEMIEIPISEIVQRWTPHTDLSPLINIRNKYFYQTNVLGKIVNIVRKMNQTPPATFKEKESIKIPQFYNSGYITITIL